MSTFFRSEAGSVSDADLKRRRAQIRLGLSRANTASVVVLLIVLGLSVAAVFQAFRAERSAEQAGQASRRAEEQLWRSQLAQARAQRLSGLAGRKGESLAAIASAAGARPSPALRDEAIAALALSDVAEDGPWQSAHIYTGEQPAFAPDLDSYALGRVSGEVSVFRMATHERIFQFEGPPSFADEVRFSRQGQILGAHFDTGEVVAWGLTNGGRLCQVRSGPRLDGGMSFDFSPDDRMLAVACGRNGVRLFGLPAGTELRRLPMEGDPSGMSFRPDGQMLAVSVGTNILFWNLSDGRMAQVLPHPEEVIWFAWHADGHRLASACAAGREVWLWDTRTTNCLILKGHSELVHHLSFNHRGDVLMSTAWDGTTRFWNASSGEPLFVSREGFGLQFSRDDARIGYVRESQGLGVWSVASSAIYREVTLPLGSTRHIFAFDFSPDGRALAAANADGLHLWDLTSGAHVAFAPHGNGHSASFTEDGTGLVLVAGDHLHRWGLIRTGNQVQLQNKGRLEFQPQLGLEGGSITRGSRHLLAVPSTDRVFCVDLGDPTAWWALPGQGLIGAINSAAISPDTNWVATSCWKDGGTYVWDTTTRERVHSFGSSGGFVTFSPDSRWLLVGSAHGYALWETRTWRPIWELSRRSPGELTASGAFSPDGGLIALCPEMNLLQLVETETGRKIATLQAPAPKNLGWVAFSRDGSTLAAATFDNEIQLWNLPETRRQLATLGLDWKAGPGVQPRALAENEAESPSAGPRAHAAGFRTTRSSGSGLFYLLPFLGLLVAVFTGVYTLRYHQRMMRSYEEIDLLATQRAGELKLAHAELLHSQKMKALGTLAAGIAHDFNNLLSVIRMGNNFQRRGDTSPEDKAESSAAVERAVEQGRKVVRSMLGYSRDQPEGRQTYSVPELVEEVVLLLSQPFLSGLTLTLELNRDTLPATGARGRLEQILLNLIVNASEAMDGKGRLRIALRPVAGASRALVLRPQPAARYVELMVADTGPGIDPSLQDRIFEPFFSTKPLSTTSGTGLGLSLVHSLAEQEGMGIGLESTPGQGTVITILVPVEEARGTRAQCAADAHCQDGPTRGE